MTYPHPATQDIGIITREVTGKDQYGNDTYTPSERVVAGLYAPVSSSENTAGAEQVFEDGSVIIPDPPSDLRVEAVDAVRTTLPAETFEVVGRPQTWGPGVILRVKRDTG